MMQLIHQLWNDVPLQKETGNPDPLVPDSTVIFFLSSSLFPQVGR